MKHKDRLRKVAEKQSEQGANKTVNLKLREAALLSLTDDPDQDVPYVNLKYYYHEHQCFSEWVDEELRAFSAFCRKLTQVSWADIYKTGGSLGMKTGIGYTEHKNKGVLPKNSALDSVSPELTWFELRVTGKARVHGFRCKSGFFLVYLDRQHEIYPN